MYRIETQSGLYSSPLNARDNFVHFRAHLVGFQKSKQYHEEISFLFETCSKYIVGDDNVLEEYAAFFRGQIQRFEYTGICNASHM